MLMAQQGLGCKREDVNLDSAPHICLKRDRCGRLAASMSEPLLGAVTPSGSADFGTFGPAHDRHVARGPLQMAAAGWGRLSPAHVSPAFRGLQGIGGSPNNSRVDLKSDPQQHFVNRRRGIIQDGLMFSRSI